MQVNPGAGSLSLFSDEWSNQWFEVMQNIMGTYEYKGDEPKNDWHYVTISPTYGN